MKISILRIIFLKMVLQKYKIYVIFDLVFIILTPFLKIINIDVLIINH